MNTFSEQIVQEILSTIYIEDSESWIVRFGGNHIELRTRSPAGDDEYKHIANETLVLLNSRLSPNIKYKLYSIGKTGFHLIAGSKGDICLS